MDLGPGSPVCRGQRHSSPTDGYESVSSVAHVPQVGGTGVRCADETEWTSGGCGWVDAKEHRRNNCCGKDAQQVTERTLAGH